MSRRSLRVYVVEDASGLLTGRLVERGPRVRGIRGDWHERG
ncbi:MAG: hypothetical protein WDO74_29035 [Pseudomonadota bacterium]